MKKTLQRRRKTFCLLADKFFDNAWHPSELKKYGRYSANYEFVAAAEKASFDLRTTVFEVKPVPKGKSCSYTHFIEVPFDTMQSGWWGGFTYWHGMIPLNAEEFVIVPRATLGDT